MTPEKIIAEECPWEDEFDSDLWEEIAPIKLKKSDTGRGLTAGFPSSAANNSISIREGSETKDTTEKDSEEEGELELLGSSNDEYNQKISAKIAEKANWLSQTVLNPTKDQISTPRSTKRQSKLIAERLEWIHNQVLANATGSKSKQSLLDKKSRSKGKTILVAERHRFIEEQQRQLPVTSPRNLDPTLFQGLASDRSKWFQELAQEHAKAGEAWSLLEERRKKNPKRFLVRDKHDYEKDTMTTNSIQAGVVAEKSRLFGGNKEKHAGWLLTPQDHGFIAQQVTAGGVVLAESEDKMTLTEMIISTYHDIVVELEHEGFLPALLADNTTWIFGSTQGFEDVGHTSVPCETPAWIDKLRIDFDSDSEEPSPTEITRGSSEEEGHQDGHFAASIERTNNDVLPEHSDLGLRQRKGANNPENERESDGKCSSSKGEDPDVETEIALNQWSEMSSEQCCGTLRASACPFCEIL